MTPVEILLIALAVLQVGDGYLTLAAFKLGGREGNPVLLKLDEKIGKVAAILLAKGIALVVIGVLFYYKLMEGTWFGIPILVALNALYAWVCWNNFVLWKKLSSRSA